MKNFSADDRLKAAEASPAAIIKRDKRAWLSLFASEAVIEDPVGIVPYRSRATSRGIDNTQLEKFYDTFIAPNEIKFHVFKDIVVANKVMRDVTIEIRSSTGLVTSVPMYLLYELTEESGRLKVARLAAHWELKAMIRRVISKGWPGLRMMTALGFRMLRLQGIGGIRGYSKGFTGIGRNGKVCVLRFAEALNLRNTNQLVDLFAPDNSGIEYPVGESNFTPYAFVDAIDLHIKVSDLISAGMVTAFRFEAKGKGSTEKGVGLFWFDTKTKKISSARFFK